MKVQYGGVCFDTASSSMPSIFYRTQETFIIVELTEKQKRSLKMPAHLKKAVKISDIYKWQILDANFLIDLENGKVHWDDLGANI